MSWQSGQRTRSLARPRKTLESQAPGKQRRYTFGSHANACHVWAQQNKETWIGQASDGRIRFEGETIYSHGSHFPMAKFVGKYDGHRVVLVNGDKYSTSTGTHQSLMRRALRNDDLQIWLDTAFLKASKPSVKMVKTAQEGLFEQIATAIRPAANRWVQRSLTDARLRLAAFRHLYRPRFKVPKDIVAWSDERKAKAERAKLRRKWVEARRIVQQCRGVTEAMIDTRYPPPAETWTARDIKRKIDENARLAKQIGSARIVLSKVKAARKDIRTCSKVLAMLKTRRELWTPWVDAAVCRERYSDDMQSIRNWPDGGHHSVAEMARLWALAISEDLPDKAEAIGSALQLRQLQSEMPGPRYSYSYGQKPVSREDWLTGVGDASQYHIGMAVRRRGDKLQTSMGAECPFDHAVAAFRVAQRCRKTHSVYQHNGHTIHVGHFRIDRIEADGMLKAGCHVIPYEEMLRLAVREVPHLVEPTYPVPALRGA